MQLLSKIINTQRELTKGYIIKGKYSVVMLQGPQGDNPSISQKVFDTEMEARSNAEKIIKDIYKPRAISCVVVYDPDGNELATYEKSPN